MLQKGYLPTEDYVGIMGLNKELREQNKRLRAELISTRVEHERLLAEDAFLRESAQRAGLEVPPEVVHRPPTASGAPGGLAPAPF